MSWGSVLPEQTSSLDSSPSPKSQEEHTFLYDFSRPAIQNCFVTQSLHLIVDSDPVGFTVGGIPGGPGASGAGIGGAVGGGGGGGVGAAVGGGGGGDGGGGGGGVGGVGAAVDGTVGGALDSDSVIPPSGTHGGEVPEPKTH